MKNFELAELVIHVRENKEENFRELFNAISKTVYYLSLKMLEDPVEAEDATQETLLYIYNHFDELQTPEGFNTWMNRIVFGTCANIRKRKANPKEKIYLGNYGRRLQEKRTMEPEGVAQNKESKEVVLNIINQLPEKQKEVVLLYYYQELTAKEIAEILSCSQEAVKNRLYKAKRSIKEKVEGSKELQAYQLYSLGGMSFIVQLLGAEMQETTGQQVQAQLWQSFSQQLTDLHKLDETSDTGKSIDDEHPNKRSMIFVRKTVYFKLSILFTATLVLVIAGFVVIGKYTAVNKKGVKNSSLAEAQQNLDYFQKFAGGNVDSFIIHNKIRNGNAGSTLEQDTVQGESDTENWHQESTPESLKASQEETSIITEEAFRVFQLERVNGFSERKSDQYVIERDSSSLLYPTVSPRAADESDFEWRTWEEDSELYRITNEALIEDREERDLQFEMDAEDKKKSDAVYEEEDYRDYSEITYHSYRLPQIEYMKKGTFVNGSELQLDDVVTYTIAVRNSGEAAAKYIILKDAIPEFTSFISGSAASDKNSTEFLYEQSDERATLLWIIEDLQPGEKVEASFKVRITDQSQKGQTLIRSTALINVIQETDNIYAELNNENQFAKSNEIVYQLIADQGKLDEPKTGDKSNLAGFLIMGSSAVFLILCFLVFEKLKRNLYYWFR